MRALAYVHQLLVHLKDGVQTVYTTANSPLLHNVVASVDLDLDGHVWLNNSSTGGNAAIFEFDGTSWRQFTVGAELPWALPWRRLSVACGSKSTTSTRYPSSAAAWARCKATVDLPAPMKPTR